MTGNVFSDPNITQKLMQPESLITQRICNILTLPEKGRSSIPTLQKKKRRIKSRERNQTMNRKMVSEDPPHAQALPPPNPAPKPPSHLLHRRASRPGTGGDGGDAGEPRLIRGEAEPGGGAIGGSE